MSLGVYRAPMPGAVELAVELAVVGVPVPADERAERRLERFCAVPDGAEVWSRDDAGFFHRGVVDGSCRPGPGGELGHVRPCAWDDDALGEHQVPAAVAATYRRGGRNFQRIRAL